MVHRRNQRPHSSGQSLDQTLLSAWRPALPRCLFKPSESGCHGGKPRLGSRHQPHSIRFHRNHPPDMKPSPRLRLKSFQSTPAQPHFIRSHHPALAVFTTLVSKLYSRLVASRNRGGKFNIQNRCVAPLTPFFLNPLTPRYCVAAFTLIELMAATTVLSVILLMMVGMQDQMSKAWSNANRRTDATREARAASLLMARDLSTFAMRGKTIGRFFEFPNQLNHRPRPLLLLQRGRWYCPWRRSQLRPVLWPHPASQPT